MGEILLRAENIDKHFGITHALDNVSFTFNKISLLQTKY